MTEHRGVAQRTSAKSGPRLPLAPDGTLALVVLLAAGAAAGIAVVVLFGWAADLSRLPRFASGDSEMVPWTAVGCLAGALGAIAWGRLGEGRGASAVSLCLATIVLAVGAIATLENLAGIDLGVDTLLWPASVADTAQEHGGRPSLQTAIALTVLGGAQLAISLDRRRRTIDAAGLAGCGVAALGLLGLAGRALQIAPTFTSDQLGSGGLSVLTAAALTLIGTALATATLGPSLLELARRSTAARRQLRILLPLAVAIPLCVFLGAYASLELSGAAQAIGPLVAAVAVVTLVWALRFVNLGVFLDVTAHSEVERSLGGRLALYAAAVEFSDDAILTKDLDGTITSWNPAAERLYGYSAQAAVGQSIELIVPEERQGELRSIIGRLSAGERVEQVETLRRRVDGEQIEVSLTVSPVLDAAGEVVGASSIERDVSERRRAEAELARRTEDLREAQKMEAIGRLGGGVAHDFNNILTVIAGASHLLRARLAGRDEELELVQEVSDSAKQAAELTAQLLAFGRRAEVTREVLMPNDLLSDNASMLTRLIGSDIKFVLDLDPRLGSVSADPTQFQQVIMNLAINARDAMPTGGTLTIATSEVELREPPRGSEDAEPGRFVRIDVTDDGVGMDAEQASRIFEPFYTTKEEGKGTGLGLATSHGIVAQHGGGLSVRSEPGEGTTFSILLPRVDGKSETATVAEDNLEEAAGGEGTILLTDDQEALRRVAVRVLSGAGYEVLDASNGTEALRIADAYEGEIDMLLTDLVMPEMNGYELAEAVRERRPQIKILYMSGHPPKTRERYGQVAAEWHLEKPFTPDSLRRRVRQVLDGTRRPQEAEGTHEVSEEEGG